MEKKETLIIRYHGDNFGDNLLLEKIKTMEPESTVIESKYNFISIFTHIIKCKKMIFIGELFQDYSSIFSFLYYCCFLITGILFKKNIFLLSSSINLKSFLSRLILKKIFSAGTQLIHLHARDLHTYFAYNKILTYIYCIKDIADTLETMHNCYELNSYNFDSLINSDKNSENSQFFLCLNKNHKSRYRTLFTQLRKNEKSSVYFLVTDKKELDYWNKLNDQLLLKEKKIVPIYSKSLFNSFLQTIPLPVKSKGICIFDRLHPSLVMSHANMPIYTIPESKTYRYIDTWYGIKNSEKKD